jgi:hypothetical protein
VVRLVAHTDVRENSDSSGEDAGADLAQTVRDDLRDAGYSLPDSER